MILKWLLVSDVDDTLVGDDDALARFVRTADACDGFGYVLNSSRPVASVARTLAGLSVELRPLAVIGAMGTEISIEGTLDEQWAARFTGWDRSEIDRLMADFGFQPHAAEMQTALKASFDVDKKSLQRVIDAIESRAQACRVVISGATNFDVLPPNAGKGPATLACLERFGTGDTQLICAGDSANDVELLEVAHFGILVENADGDLRDAVDPRRTYFARKPYADGVLDGLQNWGVPISSSSESIPRRTT